MLTEPLTCGPVFKSWSGGACAAGAPDTPQVLLEYDRLRMGSKVVQEPALLLYLSCQNSSQSKSGRESTFPVAPKVSLPSSRRNLFYSLLALFMS